MSREIFSIPAFIAWAETQDPEARYDWRDCEDCLCMRYLKERGVQDVPTGYGAFGDTWLRNDIFAVEPWTYGAALARAKELVAP